GLSPDRFNPLPHDSQAWESLLGSPVAGAHRGLTPQMHDMPVVPEKALRIKSEGLETLLNQRPNF
ncbi:hypothetical protein, partial [Streptococcus pseudopneumoniae]|uniref:hypothetical protein n=1 Tax=Streptococcus pseudopneumoniae TaxID=257758 RepID=UPI001486B740